MNKKAIRIVGVSLLVVGVAVLAYGVLMFIDFDDSFAGEAVGAVRRLDSALTGGRNFGLTNTEKKAILVMIAGGFACIIGSGLVISTRR